MSKFTPGPWLIADNSKTFVYALNDKGTNVFFAQVQDAHTNKEELESNARLIAAAPELLEALQDYEAAMNMPIYGDYSDFVFPENKLRVEGNSAWGNICAKHGLSYGGGCICCRDDFNNHKERKDYLARCASDDALRAARNKARAVIAKATGGSDV